MQEVHPKIEYRCEECKTVCKFLATKSVFTTAGQKVQCAMCGKQTRVTAAK